MITVKNYKEQVKNVDWAKVPANVIDNKSDFESIMEFYNDDIEIKETLDLYFAKISKALPKKSKIKQIADASDNIIIASVPKQKEVTLKPENLTQFKAWLKHSIGEKIYFTGNYRRNNGVEVLTQERVIKTVQTNSFSTSFENGEKETWMDFDKAIFWRFFPTYAHYSNDGMQLWYHYDKPENFKEERKLITSKSRQSTRQQLKTLKNVTKYVPTKQLNFLKELNSEEYDELLKDLEKQLAAIPNKPQGESLKDSIVYAHYFYGGSDWYVLDNTRNNELFGFVILNGDHQNSEAGYMSLEELTSSNVELDFHWTKDKLGNILNKKSSYYDFKMNSKSTALKPKSKKPSNKKATQKKKVAKTVDAKMVDNYNKEFLLIRRFYNLVSKKETAPFRTIQLIYIAFQKAVVSRDVRKTSEFADLFSKVNKKVVNLYGIVEPKKQNADIEFSDKDLLREMEAFVKGSKVNYAVSLLKSVISLQGYKPEIVKVERLIKRIENSIKSGRIDKNNRLYKDIIEAKKELQSYVENPSQKIDPEFYGLSLPQRSVCVNRIKCDGLSKNGKLLKGYKFAKGGAVIKKKTKSLGTVHLDFAPNPIPEKTAEVKEGYASAVELDKDIQEIKVIQSKTVEAGPKTQIKENVAAPIRTNSKTKNPYIKKLGEAKKASEHVTNFDLKGPFAEFLGKLEKKPKGSVAITLDAPPGAGKTRSMFQFMNMAANSGYSSIFVSLEEHPESKLFNDKAEQYIDPNNYDLIDVVGDLPPTYKEFISMIINSDVIIVDSWNKVYEKFKPDFDRDLRLAIDGKIIATIFQRTTNGTMRGGAKAAFDGDVILEIVKNEDFRKSYIQARKNRYQNTPLHEIGYNFFYEKIINPQEVNDEVEMPYEMKI